MKITAHGWFLVAAILSSSLHLPAQETAPSLQPPAGMLKNLKDFGLSPTNTAEDNAARLQKAIDWASPRGAALFLEPSDEPYPVDGGIVLRRNVSIIGVHGPVGRGTKHPTKPQPVGSVFSITDEQRPFITVESSTQLAGLQFWYPRQTLRDPAAIIPYPPTIQVSHSQMVQGVTLSRLTFYGEYLAMDFNASRRYACEQILAEHCYGYPLSGEFIRIQYCYDVPRILHCHVNPANLRLFKGGYSKAVIDAVVARKTFTYAINNTDNAQLMDLFTFGVYGGLYLGPATYGQLSNFNFDCVAVGILKLGDNSFNRNWQIAQGSIIANAGPSIEETHPLVIEGRGHTALANVEAFSGDNGALTNWKQSQDFMLVRGNDKLTISMFGCRMRNYRSDQPITCLNTNAVIQAVACIDKNEMPFNQGPEK